MKDIDRLVFWAGLSVLAVLILFGLGFAVATYRIAPYQSMKDAKDLVDSLVEHGEFIPENLRWPAPRGASREEFVAHQPQLQSDGTYVFLIYDNTQGHYVARRYSALGEHLHTWDLNYSDLNPDSSVDPATVDPHGFAVLNDGSVILGHDGGKVMARVGYCGETIWSRSGIFHHSLELTGSGTALVWRSEGDPKELFHHIDEIDVETGETVHSISLVDDIIVRSGDTSLIFNVRHDYPFRGNGKAPVFPVSSDPFHPNDAEALTEELAPAFPMFEVGDVLISLRSSSLVAVVGRQDGNIKWWRRGPWSFQHDPDFQPNGMISVLDNNTAFGRSEIIYIDPRTDDIYNPLRRSDLEFYTGYQGKHQVLNNRNILIAVTMEGRALEFSPSGDLVAEYNNVVAGDKRYNDDIKGALFFADGYFQDLPNCK